MKIRSFFVLIIMLLSFYSCSQKVNIISGSKNTESRHKKQLYNGRNIKIPKQINLLSKKEKKLFKKYKLLLLRNSEKAKIHYNLGLLYYKMGLLNETYKELKETLKINPSFIPAIVALSSYYKDRGQVDKAVKLLEQLKKLNVEDQTVNIDLAILYRKIGLLDKSLKLSLEVIKKYGLVYDASFNVGLVYLKMGKNYLARSVFLNLEKIKPKDARLHLSLGIVYQNINNFSLAINEYQTAVSYDTSIYEALNNLGTIYLIQDKPDKAEQYLLKAVTANQNFYKGFLNLAIAQRKQEKFSISINNYKRAISINPFRYEAYYDLALLYSDYKFDPIKALKYWVKVKEIINEDKNDKLSQNVDGRIIAVAPKAWEKMKELEETLKVKQYPKPITDYSNSVSDEAYPSDNSASTYSEGVTTGSYPNSNTTYSIGMTSSSLKDGVEYNKNTTSETSPYQTSVTLPSYNESVTSSLSRVPKQESREVIEPKPEENITDNSDISEYPKKVSQESNQKIIPTYNNVVTLSTDQDKSSDELKVDNSQDNQGKQEKDDSVNHYPDNVTAYPKPSTDINQNMIKKE